MASIIPHFKDGKIVSYKFKSCVGRDDCGKQVFRCMTWKVPCGLAPSKAVKAAEKAAAGESGMGAYHGKTGFDAFSHTKSILDKKTWMDLPMRYQSYNRGLYGKLQHRFLSNSAYNQNNMVEQAGKA